MHIDFYFDFISPYAYFAFRRIESIAAEAGASLTLHPVLFAGLLNHWGQLGPAEIPPKKEFTARDIARYAVVHDFELRGPAAHPFNPLIALRAALAAGDERAKACRAIFDAGWGRGIDLGDETQIAAALNEAGLDGAGLVAATADPAVKKELHRTTAAAIARGVFGVPTMLVGDALFWGNDQLDYLRSHLAGQDPLDRVSGGLPLGRREGAQRRSKP